MISIRRALLASMGLLGLLVLAGCASSKAGPGVLPMPAGMSCSSVRSELAQLDRKGTRAHVEAVNAGRKVSGGARQDVDRYNHLLSVYLGAQCHN